MSLGYWLPNYWPVEYWDDDYWQDLGTDIGIAVVVEDIAPRRYPRAIDLQRIRELHLEDEEVFILT